MKDNDKVPQTAQSKYLPNLVVLGRACDFGCGSTASYQIYHDVTLSCITKKMLSPQEPTIPPKHTHAHVYRQTVKDQPYTAKSSGISQHGRDERKMKEVLLSLCGLAKQKKKCYQSGQDRCLQSPSLLLSPSLLVWTAMIWVTWGNNLMTTARLNAAGLGGLVGLWGTDYHVQCV